MMENGEVQLLEYREMIKSAGYEVQLHVNTDIFLVKFPKRTQIPPSEAYNIAYKIDDSHPRNILYHLIMADISARCKMIGYNVSLIGLYYNDGKTHTEIPHVQLVDYMILGKKDRDEHNLLGEYLAYIKECGFSKEIVKEAKSRGLYQQLKTILAVYNVRI